MKTEEVTSSRSVIQVHVLACIFMVFVSVSFVQSVAAAGGQGISRSDMMTYMVEVDNLRLDGLVLSKRNWGEQDRSRFNQEMFEPVVLRVNVLSQSGDCEGEQDFYLKKGVPWSSLSHGDSILFSINKNMCHSNTAFIILDLTVLNSASR